MMMMMNELCLKTVKLVRFHIWGTGISDFKKIFRTKNANHKTVYQLSKLLSSIFSQLCNSALVCWLFVGTYEINETVIYTGAQQVP